MDVSLPSTAPDAERSTPPQDAPESYFERQVARLLIVLYYCGQPVADLISGETRQVDSLGQLHRFDFWVREPGHLALALLDTFAATPDNFAATRDTLVAALERILRDNQADTHRQMVPGAPYNLFEDFDYPLSFLTSRALVSDRPSFTRSRSQAHRLILEASGMAVVKQILDQCPSFEWYRHQCETIAAFLPELEKYDLTVMTYLPSELNMASLTTATLSPFIQRRYQRVFGANGYANL